MVGTLLNGENVAPHLEPLLPVPCISPPSFWLPEHFSISAWLEHAPFAFWLISAAQPSRSVELGSHYGFSFFTFCQAIKKLGLPSTCYAVDTWQGDEHAGFYGEEVFNHVRAIQNAHYAQFSHLIRSTFDDALVEIADESVDLLHIDGRHTYEDARHDFMSWLPKLSKHAIVLFHDTQVCDRNFGVFRLWQELCSRYQNFEFQHGYGLGVLAVGSDIPLALKSLFHANAAQQEDIRSAYARLGMTISLISQNITINNETLKVRE